MKRIESFRWLGVGGAVLLPVLAVAELDIPNSFTAGDPVSAGEMNDNFDAIKAKVEELEALLDEHETTEAWIEPTSLLNGWTNDDSPDNSSTAGYRKDKHGMVHLKGVVVPGTDQTILMLPAGYRPAEELEFAAIGYDGGAEPSGVAVATTGAVDAYNISLSGEYISLDGISFLAED